MTCSLNYIPKHLHTSQKLVLDSFSIGEEIYYRIKSENLKKPYDKISLYDISHNRNFNDSLNFPKEDVLFNIDENDIRIKYEDLEILTLRITRLENNVTYICEIISRDDNFTKAKIILKHRPEACMYPHSIFEISLNGTIIDEGNYKTTLGKDNKLFKNMRNDIRQELTSLLQTGIIDSTKKIEIIEFP